MGQAPAIKLAIDLMHFPSQVRSVRSTSLPDDVLVLLRIAAGDEQATREAAESVGRPQAVVRDAAAFFIEQALLHPAADSYRVLGAKPETPYGELRQHMALLLKWLHPDKDRLGERTVFATRVTRAWNDLKTQERRAAYDRSRLLPNADSSLLRKDGARRRRQASNLHSDWQRAYDGQVRYRQSPHAYVHEGEGLLHRIMFRLFGRGAP